MDENHQPDSAFSEDRSDALKKIRERTFNPEFRRLFSMVSGTKDEEDDGRRKERQKNLSERLNALLARAENIPDYTGSWKHIKDLVFSYEENFSFSPADDLNDLLKAKGFYGFTLLLWNRELSEMTAVLNTMPGKANTVLGLNDLLLTKTGLNRKGMFLSGTDAMSLTGTDSRTRVFALPEGSGHPLSVLLVYCPAETQLNNAAAEIAELKPFQVLAEKLFYPDLSVSGSVPDLIRKAGFFFRMAVNKGACGGAVCSLSAEKALFSERIVTDRFIFSSLYEKMKNRLSGRAFFFRCRFDRFGVFYTRESEGDVRSLLAETEDISDMEFFSADRADSMGLFIRKTLFM